MCDCHIEHVNYYIFLLQETTTCLPGTAREQNTKKAPDITTFSKKIYMSCTATISVVTLSCALVMGMGRCFEKKCNIY